MAASHSNLLDGLVVRLRAAFRQGAEDICRRIEEIHGRAGHPRRLDRADQAFFLSAIYLLVRVLRMRYIVQTGTCVGDSTLAVALALEESGGDGVIETIDPEPERYGGIGPLNPVEMARTAVAAGGLSHRVIFHHGYSVIPWDRSRGEQPPAPNYVLPWLASRPRNDLLIVDGDHSFEGVVGDLEFGRRCLRLDGPRLIFVHDYRGIPSVRRGVREWIAAMDTSVDLRVYEQGCGFALIQLHTTN